MTEQLFEIWIGGVVGSVVGFLPLAVGIFRAEVKQPTWKDHAAWYALMGFMVMIWPVMMLAIAGMMGIVAWDVLRGSKGAHRRKRKWR